MTRGDVVEILQVHYNSFLPKEWIMEKWEEGYYITAVSGSDNNSSLVVMSKGTRFTQQSYKVADSFPFEWIKKKWREGFYVTAMATCVNQWAVVMSKTTGIIDQVGPRAFVGRGPVVVVAGASSIHNDSVEPPCKTELRCDKAARQRQELKKGLHLCDFR